MITPYALGRNVNHDPRSWAYRVAPAPVRKSAHWNRIIPVLDQGQLGSCTGNAGTGVLGSQPHWDSKPVLAPSYDEAFAVKLYSDATMVDSDPAHYPPTDTGSDGLSIAKVLKARGLISGYQHAFGIDDAISAIQQGPLMVGSVWTEGMFTPDSSGKVIATGAVQGGHEYECIGYDADTETWEFVNSWGTDWAKAGHFFMTTGMFAGLLKQQGDIVLLLPLSVPAPTPVTDPKVAAAATLDAWAAKKHVGSAKAAAEAWKVYRG